MTVTSMPLAFPRAFTAFSPPNPAPTTTTCLGCVEPIRAIGEIRGYLFIRGRLRAAAEILSPINAILLSCSRFSLSQYGLVISLKAWMAA